MSNQWRIWNTVSGNKMSAAIIVVEVTKVGSKLKINKNEVEIEIMTCLSKRFLLTNDNLTMDQEFESEIDYLSEKGAEEF